MKKPELLAPAGDYSCFQAAIRAGADAVYLGGQQYGARAFAGNFSKEELLSALDEAHFFGKKIYLTVNTLMKQEELDHLEEFIAPFYQAGLDGVIVQDVGAVTVLKRCFPNLPLHASTQMTITDADGANALKDLGIVRVVPARELSLKEIKELRRESGMEVETFIHGAMCYCYSGQCLFSSFLGGRSGNRGRCAQPCRQPYSINGGSECYPLSLKDMCTLPFIPDLMDAGIDSFKIEGRMKKPEYVAGVTAAYRRRIDDYYRTGVRRPASQEDMRMLSSLYIRSSVSGGYYDRHNGKDMITYEQPGYAGNDETVLSKIRTDILEKEITRPVQMMAVLMENIPLQLSAYALDEEGTITNSVSLEGGIVQAAKNRPLTKADVEKQLRKTGGTGFHMDSLHIEMDDNLFLPVKEINELRRLVLEELKKQMIAENISYEPVPGKVSEVISVSESFEKAEKFRIHTLISTREQLEVCLKNKVSRIYVPYFIASAISEERKNEETEIFLTLPAIMRSETEDQMKLIAELITKPVFDGVQISSPSAVTWLKKQKFQGRIAFDHRMYLWNRETYAYWESVMDTYCAPLELNRRDLFRLPAAKKEVMVYGHIPMMITANCIRKTSGQCLKENKRRNAAEEITLTDRYNTKFPVKTDCRFCYNIIYNSVPLSLHNYLEEIRDHNVSQIRLDFLNETEAETRECLQIFGSGSHAEPAYPFTTGHYKKGAQ